MESAIVERPRSLAVFEALNIYLDEMRQLIRAKGCSDLTAFEVKRHLTNALPPLMREDYLKQADRVQDPVNALDAKHVYQIIKWDWDSEYWQHFSDDDGFKNKMNYMVEVRNVVVHPNGADLSEERTVKIFAHMKSLFRVLKRETALERVGFIEHRYRRNHDSTRAEAPTAETAADELERLRDENWVMRHRVERLTARLEGRNSVLADAFAWVKGFVTLSRFRGSPKPTREH